MLNNHPHPKKKRSNRNRVLCKTGVIPPWADLHQELLSAIAERLNTNPIDILNFRCVCKSWFSSSSPPLTLFPPLPLLTPSLPNHLCHPNSLPNSNPAVLSATAIYALHPPFDHDMPSSMPKAWVMFLDQSVHGKVSIRKPFSESSYFLPINFPRNINLLGFHVSELGRFYNLSYLPANGDCRLTKPCVLFGAVLKVVMVSIGDGFAVVAVSHKGQLGLLRLGFGYNFENLGAETKWEIIHDGKGFRIDDIVDFKGRVLGIDRKGRVYEVQIGCPRTSSSKVSVIVSSIVTEGRNRRRQNGRKRVVESLGRLYLAVRYKVHEETDDLFKVYELNEDTKKWVEVKSIGDRTFFFGTEFSFSAAAELLHDFYGRNCILFKEGSFTDYRGNEDNFNLFKSNNDELHVGVCHLEDAAHLSIIESHPDYSKLLWPPPSWIWPNQMSERVTTLLTVLDRLVMRIPGNPEELETKISVLPLAQQEVALLNLKRMCSVKDIVKKVRDMDNSLKQFEMAYVSWKELCNVVGTYSLVNDERRAAAEPLLIAQKAMEHANSRLDLPSLLMRIHALILLLEEITSEAENIPSLPLL